MKVAAWKSFPFVLMTDIQTVHAFNMHVKTWHDVRRLNLNLFRGLLRRRNMNAQVNGTVVQSGAVDDLVNIQHELKAPKDKFNSFGKYHCRSCESILEAVKPLLKKYNCTLVLLDRSKELCGIPVVTAIAKF